MPRKALIFATLSSLAAWHGFAVQADDHSPIAPRPTLWAPVVIPQERVPGGPVRPLASYPEPVVEPMHCPLEAEPRPMPEKQG